MKRRVPFRQAAIDQLNSPERLDELVQVVSPRHWILLVIIGGCFAGIAMWAVLAKVPMMLKGADGRVIVREEPPIRWILRGDGR